MNVRSFSLIFSMPDDARLGHRFFSHNLFEDKDSDPDNDSVDDEATISMHFTRFNDLPNRRLISSLGITRFNRLAFLSRKYDPTIYTENFSLISQKVINTKNQNLVILWLFYSP